MDSFFDLKLLEFNKIQEKVSSYAILDEAKELVSSLYPMTDKDEIIKTLSLTNDTLIVLESYGSIDLEPYKLKEVIERLRICARLEAKEFLELAKLFKNVDRIISIVKKESNNLTIDELNSYVNKLESLRKECDLIENTIDFSGEVYSNASPLLSSLRRSLDLEEAKLHSKFDSIMKSESSKLSDQLIVLKNGRRVIPVKSEYKSHIKGIVHGESQSGLTVYIEPFAIIEIENNIESIKEKINREAERILYELTKDIFESYDKVKNDYDLINYLDFTIAKAKYAKIIKAHMPKVSDSFNLTSARHPLIDQDKVVPNDIRLKLGESMIITGPNTGGKTVVLKTLGLLAIMAQSGLLIPASADSTIPILYNVFADIGDEQSIEQSLSTFSSHMERIKNIISNIEPNSLILLDELGAGTDPKEGSALAISIVNYFRRIKLYLVVSTHFSALKAYAYSTDDIKNASVEFNEETLQPTYRLLDGIPGKSNALLISKRLGLPKEIIDNANMSNTEYETSVDELIKKIEKEGNYLSLLKDEYEAKLSELNKRIEDSNKEIKEKTQRLNKELDNIDVKRNEILIKTQINADKLLDEIKDLKKQLENNNDVKYNEIVDIKNKISELYESKEVVVLNNKEITVGDNVRIVKYDQIGVVDSIKNNKYYVTFGNINAVFSKDDLEYVDINDTKKEIPKNIQSKIALNETNILDLRGLRYEEAKEKLELFVDRAMLSSLDRIIVIHGYGTLALKKMVQSFAETHKVIKSFRSGDEKEGGSGVTVMFLR